MYAMKLYMETRMAWDEDKVLYRQYKQYISGNLQIYLSFFLLLGKTRAISRKYDQIMFYRKHKILYESSGHH